MCPPGRPARVRGLRRVLGTFDNRLNLQPGIAEHLVRLNGILRPLFQREWTRKVARTNELPEAELESFLFGAGRIPFEPVRRPLLELQAGRCFYCDAAVDSRADVDHFLPWSRYADDGLDNLVVAHAGCNASKSFVAVDRARLGEVLGFHLGPDAPLRAGITSNTWIADSSSSGMK